MYKYFLVLILCIFSHSALSITPDAESTYLKQDSTLSDAIGLDDSAYSKHQAILINQLSGIAAAWTRIALPRQQKQSYHLTMPFSLRTHLSIYAHRIDGSISEYDLGASGADTQYHTSALGYQIRLDPALIDFNIPLYIKANTSLFFNQTFDLITEKEFESLNSSITFLHKLMVISCFFAATVYAIVLYMKPSALAGTIFTLLVGLIFFTLSSVALNLITSINFRSTALQNVALFNMPLMFFLIAMCFRRVSILKIIDPTVDQILFFFQMLSLAAAVCTFFLDPDTADNIAFMSVVIGLAVKVLCIATLIFKQRKRRPARIAIITFGIPSLGTMVFIGPAYFDLAPATSTYMVLPITITIMALSLLRLVPMIIGPDLQNEQKALVEELKPNRPYTPLAMHYSTVVLLSGFIFIVSASVVQSAVESRNIESKHDEISSDAFDQIELELVNLLKARKISTPTIDKLLSQANISQVQLSALGRDGPVLYSKGSSELEHKHNSYFSVNSGGSGGVARLTLDITDETTRELIVGQNRLLGNLLLAIALSAFTLAVFRAFVTNHLESIAKHLSGIKLYTEGKALSLSRECYLHTDEFDSISSAIEKMETDLRSGYKKMRNANALLEIEVSKRTAAHKAVLEREHRKRQLVTMGLMVASVAHELRNPLGTLASSSLLISKSIGDTQPKVVERMKRSIDRCNKVVEELRSLGRQSDQKPQLTDIERWLAPLLSEYEQQYNLTIKKSFKLDSGACIDRSRLERVVIILLDNARQAIQKNHASWPESGQIRAAATIHSSALKICIDDNGGGLTQEAEEQVFEPLFTTKSSGFGMGLPIALSIVEQHQGTLKLENTDSGLSVLVTLPTEPSDDLD